MPIHNTAPAHLRPPVDHVRYPHQWCWSKPHSYSDAFKLETLFVHALNSGFPNPTLDCCRACVLCYIRSSSSVPPWLLPSAAIVTNHATTVVIDIANLNITITNLTIIVPRPLYHCRRRHHHHRDSSSGWRA